MGISSSRIAMLVALFALVVADAVVIGVRGGSSNHAPSPAALVQVTAPSSPPPTASVPAVPSVSPAPVVTPQSVPPVTHSKHSSSGFRSVPQRPLPPGSRLVTDPKGRFAVRMYGSPMALNEPAKIGPIRFSVHLEVTHDPVLIEVEGIRLSQPALQDFSSFAGSSLGSFGDSSGAKELGHKNGTFRGRSAAFAVYRLPNGTLITLVIVRWTLSSAYLIAVDSHYFDAETKSFQSVGPHAQDTSGQAT